jgi:heptosyltransferase-2
LSSLGDVILASSVPLALREAVPNARVTFLTKDTFAPLFRNNPGVDNVISFSRRGNALGDIVSLARELRSERFDLILDLQGTPRSSLLCFLARPRRRERADGDGLTRHALVRLKSFSPRRVRHSVARFLSAAQRAFGPVPAARPAVFFDEEEEESAWAFVRSSPGRGGRPIVGICPGARWQTKMWGTERMSALVHMLHGEGIDVCVLGSKTDEAVLRDVETRCEELEGVRFYSVDLRVLAGLMSRCDCVVSNDSGLMHMSHAVGTPVVAVFGSTVPEFGFYPPDSRSVVISMFFECKPCDVHGQERCKEGDMRCMESIDASRVFDEVRRIVKVRRKPVRSAKRRLELPRFVLEEGEGSVASRKWSAPSSGSIAVRVPNWVGDAVMAHPSLAALKRCTEGCTIVALAHERVVSLFEEDGLAEELVCVPSKGVASLARTALRLRKRRFRVGIAMPDSFSSALMLWLGGVKNLVGFRGELRDGMLAVGLRRNRWSHLCNQYAQLLPRDCESDGRPVLTVSPVELGGAWALLEKVGISEASPPVLLAPGASYGETKRWPEQGYARLAELLVERAGLPVVLVGTRAERELCGRIAGRCSGSVTDLSGQTNLRQLAALASLGALFVGNDSGAAHVAAASGCPVVVIFGSSDPSWTEPRGEAVKVLYRKMSCSPCFRRECPFDLQCLKEIDVEEVFEAALEMCREESGNGRGREQEEGGGS